MVAFLAHREEILEQSIWTFRHALRQHALGGLWVGGRRPGAFDHVFASIQSLSAAGLAHLDPTHFDVMIVDEFHHAGAVTYRALTEVWMAAGAGKQRMIIVPERKMVAVRQTSRMLCGERSRFSDVEFLKLLLAPWPTGFMRAAG